MHGNAGEEMTELIKKRTKHRARLRSGGITPIAAAVFMTERRPEYAIALIGRQYCRVDSVSVIAF